MMWIYGETHKHTNETQMKMEMDFFLILRLIAWEHEFVYVCAVCVWNESIELKLDVN